MKGMCVFYLAASEGWKPSASREKMERPLLLLITLKFLQESNIFIKRSQKKQTRKYLVDVLVLNCLHFHIEAFAPASKRCTFSNEN